VQPVQTTDDRVNFKGGDQMSTRELEKTRVQQIVSLHNQIVADLKRSLDSAIQIGGLLAEQKKNLKHGQFGAWIESNLPITDI
jgi:hypothetical protein